jgi:hypothetical protein
MRRLVAAILGFIATLVLLPILARAAPDVCWERNTLVIRLDTLGASSARRLKDEELAGARRWFNAQPPVSDIEWQTIILAELPNGAGLILIGKEDQVCIRMSVPPEHWLKVKLQILGLPV